MNTLDSSEDTDAAWVMEVWVGQAGLVFRFDFEEWVLIMNPRSLKVALAFAKRRVDSGLVVRLRNVKTEQIIPGDLL
jgi:hypothetical protein